MKIGVHAHAAFKRQKTGVERYAEHLLSRILRLPEARSHQWKLYTPHAPHPDDDMYLRTQARRARWHLPAGWTQLRLPFALLRDRPDVFFAPAHVLPPLTRNGVVVIHGVEFEVYPHHYTRRHRAYLHWATRAALQRAAHVIAVSHATKRDIIRFFDIAADRITVIHHGIESPPANPLTLPSSTPPYLLGIGRLETKKNPEILVAAFEMLARRGHPHRLVWIGGDGVGSQAIRRRIAASPAQDRITLTGYISDRAKWALLEQADMFVFPSMYEGFGFPVLEAQRAGVPVVSSNTSSLPEVLGSSALLVDPVSPLGMCEAIERIIEDVSLRASLQEAGRENVKRFSWERCAEQTLDILLNQTDQ